MFTKEQIEQLEQELDSNRIKSRSKGNVNLSYLEGFDVIETANSIFGFGNWSYSITTLNLVSEEQNSNQNTVICYKAIVRLTVQDTTHSKSIHREDIGFGTGISKTLADAHEGAGKEAVTDALKRGLKSLGNQFGLSLYDKSRNQQPQNQTSYSQNNGQQSQRNNQPQNYQNQPANTQPPKRNSPPQKQQQAHYDPYEYESLNRIGLEVYEDNGFLVVSGDDQFSKKDSIKACGFNWDKNSKTWYKAINTQQVA
ncbi:MAG: Rad52/Rad22 family DNA repair protein [Arcobacteraceae bacterium]|jgi:DNA repair and recombination protein RAD52|nr:Rad52/Rad22 family DNA repair protein [Arcobacteraceae bacterium]